LSRGGMIPEQSARRGTQKTYVPQGKCPQMRKDMKPQQIRERWRNSTAVVDDFRIARKLQSGIPRIRLKIVNSPTLGPVHLYCAGPANTRRERGESENSGAVPNLRGALAEM